MKITIKRNHEDTPVELGEFADRHNLELEVVERNAISLDFIKRAWGKDSEESRFYANFKRVEVKSHPEGGTLSGVYGNGRTPRAAIEDYCKEIQDQLLVYDAYGDKRTVFRAPVNLVFTESLEEVCHG